MFRVDGGKTSFSDLLYLPWRQERGGKGRGRRERERERERDGDREREGRKDAAIVTVKLLYTLAGHVGSGVTVSDGCVVGAACEVVSIEKITPDTVIYGSDCRRYTKSTPIQVMTPHI